VKNLIGFMAGEPPGSGNGQTATGATNAFAGGWHLSGRGRLMGWYQIAAVLRRYP